MVLYDINDKNVLEVKTSVRETKPREYRVRYEKEDLVKKCDHLREVLGLEKGGCSRFFINTVAT